MAYRCCTDTAQQEIVNLDNPCSHRFSSFLPHTWRNAKVDYSGIFVTKAKLEGEGENYYICLEEISYAMPASPRQTKPEKGPSSSL